jgi:3-deoxy-D-manno-octulosonate 8-phosphate phosphatase (KDO 8-P phosphatase)
MDTTEKNIFNKIKKIKIFITDVDGVLTDGRIVIDNNGMEYKFFNVKDGHGIKMLKRYGYKVAFVTGRESEIVLHRAKELEVDNVFQKVFNKLEVVEKILAQYNFTFEELLFCGDDVVDIPVIKRAAIGCTVSDAVEECKNCADYITFNKGGKGAVRELTDLILKNSSHWKAVREKYEI